MLNMRKCCDVSGFRQLNMRKCCDVSGLRQPTQQP